MNRKLRYFFFSQKKFDELRKMARSSKSSMKISFCMSNNGKKAAYTHVNCTGKKPTKDAVALGEGKHCYTFSYSRLGKNIPAG
jgi:hypothetical protein